MNLMSKTAASVIIATFCLPGLAIKQPELNEEAMKNLASVLKPEIVSSIYELNARTNTIDAKYETAHMAEAVVAGVAGAIAAEMVKEYFERSRADDKKTGRAEVIVDDNYFDVDAK